MNELLARILPEDEGRRRWAVVLSVSLICGLLTAGGIYGLGEYGVALFLLIPLFLGVSSTLLLGHGRILSLKQSCMIGLLTLLVFSVGLMVFAIEGAICVVMASPIGIGLTLTGSAIGYVILNHRAAQSTRAMMFFLLIVPGFAFFENGQNASLHEVTTSIEINAPPDVVWKQVIEFPELGEPQQWIFRAGIAYPTSARIEGHGVGAIRNCNFNTGSFVEPITVWNEPHHLAFDVVEQPAPMKEISFWEIDAPHLHDTFVSKKGEFRLIALPDGRTRLEGTTWYYHRIRPEFYWQLWSDSIVHSIHERVLDHIRSNAENARETASANQGIQ